MEVFLTIFIDFIFIYYFYPLIEKSSRKNNK